MSSSASRGTYQTRHVRRSQSEDPTRSTVFSCRVDGSVRPRMPSSLGSLSPEQKQKVYEEVLEINRPFLCSHLDPSRHYAFLRSRRYFDRSTVEVINNNVTTEEKVSRFIDELLARGPDAVSAFLESLESNRVERFVFSRLADACQSFSFHQFDENESRCNSSLNYDYEDDVDDERRLPGQFDSLSVSDGDRLSMASGMEPHEAAMPRVDYQRLCEAQGLHVPDRHLEPEESSDISSVECLTSHGN